MGLDMYLRKHTSVQPFWLAMMGVEEMEEARVELINIPFVDEKKIVALVEDACYWRKVNAVHH